MTKISEGEFDLFLICTINLQLVNSQDINILGI